MSTASSTWHTRLGVEIERLRDAGNLGREGCCEIRLVSMKRRASTETTIKCDAWWSDSGLDAKPCPALRWWPFLISDWVSPKALRPLLAGAYSIIRPVIHFHSLTANSHQDQAANSH